MPILHAVILGITQGLSEFLPISSSGHLLLVPWLFGWDDFAGNPGLEKTFDVALHLGTFVGAVAYFRTDVARLVRAAFTRRPDAGGERGGAVTVAGSVRADRRIAWLLLLASVPGGLVGVALEGPIEDHAGQIWLVAVMLIVFGLVLLWADRLRGDRTVEAFGVRQALIMGGAQAMALQPGVSRSGVTITAGRWLGFDRDAAARLSFLMSLPIIGGAVAYKGLELVADGFPPGFAAPFAWGIVASGVTGYAAVWGTLRLIRSRSFAPFVVYRVMLGFSVLAVYFL